MFLAMRSVRMTAGLEIRTILTTVAEDATQYFLFIFTSHFVLEMTLIFGRVSATVPHRRFLMCTYSGNDTTFTRRVSCSRPPSNKANSHELFLAATSGNLAYVLCLVYAPYPND